MACLTTVFRAVALQIKTAVHKRRPFPQQSEDCHIVNLPAEVIFCIIANLPIHSRHVLAQTCRCLSAYAPVESLTPQENFEFLYCLARDNPKKWACHACGKLHPVSVFDIPSKPNKTKCPLGAKELRLLIGSQGFFPSYKIGHRHVQTTLKYTRLDLEGKLSWWQRRHLKNLSACYKANFKPSKDLHRLAMAEMSYWPKVVDGRYLICQQYVYCRRDMGTPISLNKMGHLSICSHQYFDFDDRGVLSGKSTSLSTLVQTGFEEWPDMVLRGCCPWCLTDFEVLCNREKTKITVYSDLGPESDSFDRAWTAFTSLGHKRLLTHEIGSVKEAFHRNKGSWKIKNALTRYESQGNQDFSASFAIF